MPPKPPIRIPAKPPSVAKSRFTPPSPAKSAPRASPRPQTSHTHPPPPPPPPPSSSSSSLLPSRTSWYKNRTLRSTASWTANTVLLGCALLWIRDHYVEIFRIQGVSMAPSINPELHETGKKDWVVIQPYMQRGRNAARGGQDNGMGGIKRGDVVTFWKPHNPEQTGIKRVVALEGDTVYPKRGYALESHGNRLKGMPDGLETDAMATANEELAKVTVPYGHVWVEGDNSRCTLDSRDVGPINKGLIVGKAMWIWRGWGEVLGMGDARGKKEREQGSRVVQGMAQVPGVFLE